MKKQNRKWSALGRRGLASLLVAVMMMGFIMPVYATGDVTEPTEPMVTETTAPTEPETTAATEPETSEVSEPGTTEEVIPGEEETVSDGESIVLTDDVVIKSSAYEETLARLTALEGETSALENTTTALKAFHDRLMDVYVGAWEDYDTGLINDEQIEQIDTKTIAIETVLMDLYGFDPYADASAYNYGDEAAKWEWSTEYDYWWEYMDNVLAKSATGVQVGGTIPVEYSGVVLGNLPASSMSHSTYNYWNYDKNGETYGREQGFDDCDRVAVWDWWENGDYANYDGITNGSTWVRYNKIGTDLATGKDVDVKVSIVAYEMAHNTLARIGLTTANKSGSNWVESGVPGVCVQDIAWVTLKYEFFYNGTNTPANIKGSTSYYDVDAYQGVHLHNGTDKVIVTNGCKLNYDANGKTTQGTNWAANTYGGGPYLYARFPAVDQNSVVQSDYGFTELFSGTTLYRTFNFEVQWSTDPNVDQYNGGGAIYHDGVPVISGDVAVKKNVTGVTTNNQYTFTATLTANGKPIVFPVSVRKDSNFKLSADHKTATFTLTHNQTKTFKELPTGAVLHVEETGRPAVSGYTLGTVTNAGGTKESTYKWNTVVAASQTKTMTFTNPYTRDKGSLTVTKKVTGDIPANLIPSSFSITVTGPEGYNQTKTVAAGKSVTFTDIPTGQVTVTENTGAVQVNNYTLTVTGNNQKVTIANGQTAAATVTNNYARHRGSLTVTKKVTGDIPANLVPKSFSITVIGPEGYNQTKTVAAGGSVTFTGIPTGQVTVTENTGAAQVTNYTLAVTGSGQNVTIARDQTAAATVTNNYTRQKGSLTVTKKVTGDLPANQIPNSFSITVTGVDGYNQTKTVAAGQSVTFTDIPTGQVTITENTGAVQVNNYTLTVTGNNQKVTIVNGQTATATVTNNYVRQKGNANITKTVESTSVVDLGRSYEFKAVLMDGTTKLWEETFYLKNGETKSYTGLPTGAVLTVTETDYSGNSITTKVGTTVTRESKVTIGNGTTQTIAFTNSRQTGSVNITKTVSSPSSVDTDRSYEFKAVLMDGNTKLWEEIFHLKHGETKNYKDLPAGAVLTVTEADYSGNNITTKVGATVTREGKVTVGNGTTQTVAYTNIRDVAEVSVKKTVSGGVIDETKKFEFTATLKDGGKSVAFADGSMSKTFTLSHNDTITFKNLPVGAELTVTEKLDENYTTSSNGSSGTTAVYVVKAGTNDLILFENKLKNSSVEVKKIIENEVDEDKTFAFTAELYNGTEKMAFPATAKGDNITFAADRMSATFTLGNNESVTFDGLPVGTNLKVVETGSADYTTVNTAGAGVNAEQLVGLEKATVTYTNTRNTGTVKVGKTVVGSTADDAVAFTFTANLYDGKNQVAFPASVGQIAGVTLEDNNKTITFTLKHGETLQISGLYAGTTLKVVEAVPENYIAQPESAEQKVETDKIKDIAFTNLRKLADVDVQKIVAGHVIHDDVEFTFTATLWDGDTQIAFPGEDTVGAKTFTLKHNQVKTFEDLFVGSTLKIVETENVSFTTENTHGEGFNAEYTVKEMNNDTIVYTNTVKTGSAKVTKTVAGGIIDKDEKFEFTATLYFRDVQIDFPDGDASKTFTLKHEGEEIFENLPIGTVLKVVETEHPFYITTFTGVADGETEPKLEIVDTAEKTLAYTNTLKETELTITKTVTGNMGDREKDFSFTVSMVDKYDNAVVFEYEGQEVTSAAFQLKHGESVTLTGIPVGSIVTIDEENEDYEATATLNGEKLRISNKGEAEVTIEDVEADEVVVNNELDVSVPVGVVLDSLPYIVILVVAIAGGVFLFLRKRKAAEED